MSAPRGSLTRLRQAQRSTHGSNDLGGIGAKVGVLGVILHVGDVAEHLSFFATHGDTEGHVLFRRKNSRHFTALRRELIYCLLHTIKIAVLISSVNIITKPEGDGGLLPTSFSRKGPVEVGSFFKDRKWCEIHVLAVHVFCGHFFQLFLNEFTRDFRNGRETAPVPFILGL